MLKPSPCLAVHCKIRTHNLFIHRRLKWFISSFAYFFKVSNIIPHKKIEDPLESATTKKYIFREKCQKEKPKEDATRPPVPRHQDTTIRAWWMSALHTQIIEGVLSFSTIYTFEAATRAIWRRGDDSIHWSKVTKRWNRSISNEEAIRGYVFWIRLWTISSIICQMSSLHRKK